MGGGGGGQGPFTGCAAFEESGRTEDAVAVVEQQGEVTAAKVGVMCRDERPFVTMPDGAHLPRVRAGVLHGLR